MYVSKHIFFGFIFSLIIWYLFPSTGIFGVSIIFFSSILIDFDHYLWYVVRKKDFNLKRAYICHIKMDKKILSFSREKRNKIRMPLCVFHGVEFLLLFGLLGIFVSRYFLFALAGFVFHLGLDILYDNFYMDRIDRLSVVHSFINSKNLKDMEKLK